MSIRDYIGPVICIPAKSLKIWKEGTFLPHGMIWTVEFPLSLATWFLGGGKFAGNFHHIYLLLKNARNICIETIGSPIAHLHGTMLIYRA